jgi:hypothetical protein
VQGIVTPVYSPQTFTVLAEALAALEAVAAPRFASELARDQATAEPVEGQCAHVASLGLCCFDGGEWKYAAWR